MSTRARTVVERLLEDKPGEGKSIDLDIRSGDQVTIRTPQGQERTGRVVMRSSHGGWVLNMGGAHGTPGIADARNIVRVKKAGRDRGKADRRLGA